MKLISFILLLFNILGIKLTAQTYQGRAWHDSTQVIPGKIQCELFDEGGEGLAFHDFDSINNGSGKLNPNDGTYFNTFRMKEGVDISYTKTKGIDNNDYNVVEPLMDQLYVGWTKPGEWIKYSVDIKEAGTYQLSLMYTANKDGKIALYLDGKDISGNLLVRSTYHFKEPVPWKQWHHWNKAENFATIILPKGKHVLTLHTVENGEMNYDYLEFNFVK
ncbi:MAG: carbohydrate-binding protein [Bacteroidota bacterium]